MTSRLPRQEPGVQTQPSHSLQIMCKLELRPKSSFCYKSEMFSGENEIQPFNDNSHNTV